MKDLKEVTDLAVEVVRAEGGQYERRQLVRHMIFRLGDQGNSTLAEEGISRAIRQGCLFQIGDTLTNNH